MTLSEGGACASEVVHAYRIAFVSTSGTVHFSSTLDSRNSSSRAAKRMLQPPFQSNKVPPKVRIFGEETSRSAGCTSEPVSAIFLRFVSTSGTVHFSSTLDSRNSSSRAAKRMLQPPFQSNKVPLSAEPAKTIPKCVYLAKKRVEVQVVLRSQ